MATLYQNQGAVAKAFPLSSPQYDPSRMAAIDSGRVGRLSKEHELRLPGLQMALLPKAVRKKRKKKKSALALKDRPSKKRRTVEGAGALTGPPAPLPLTDDKADSSSSSPSSTSSSDSEDGVQGILQ